MHHCNRLHNKIQTNFEGSEVENGNFKQCSNFSRTPVCFSTLRSIHDTGLLCTFFPMLKVKLLNFDQVLDERLVKAVSTVTYLQITF